MYVNGGRRRKRADNAAAARGSPSALGETSIWRVRCLTRTATRATPCPFPPASPTMLASRLLPLVALALVFATAAEAQTSDVRRVVLLDGTVLVGTVADESADPITVTTLSGVEQRVRRDNVSAILPLVDGRFVRADPTRTRNVVSQTGRTLGGGAKRLSTVFYLLPNASFGVTDRVDLSGAIFTTFGEGFTLVALGGKVGVVDTGTFAAALGVNVAVPITSSSEVNGAFGAAPYVALTAGSATRSVTAGATLAIGGDVTEGDVTVGNGVLLQLSGHNQLTNNLALVADLVVPVGDDGSGGVDAAVGVLPGVRFFGDKFSVDVFAVFGSDGNAFDGFAPLANFAYTF